MNGEQSEEQDLAIMQSEQSLREDPRKQWRWVYIQIMFIQIMFILIGLFFFKIIIAHFEK